MNRLCPKIAALALLLILLPAKADASGQVARLSTGSAKPGETVRVTGEGWAAGKLLQFVTCGEGGLTGSAACDMRAALATPVRADGTFVVDLQVGDPPKACPCVVHIAGVQGETDEPVNLLLALSGHNSAALPAAATVAHQLEVQDYHLSGQTAAAWFGAPEHLKLTFTVRNPTDSTLVDATLQARLGGGGSDNVFHQEKVTGLGPGQSRTFTVPVDIPLFAFGRYVVTADVGGLAGVRMRYNAYPWGLILINVAGVLLIAWGVLRRLLRRRELRHVNPADAMLPAVVRLGGLGAYLVFDDAPGARRLHGRAGAQLSLDGLRHLIGPGQGQQRGDSVLDVDALGHVLARRYPRGLSVMEEDDA
ncbi:LEA type 2 family protein [Actinoplanes sp. HUAS TT8]|uniref:NDR1/HIN1-like protein n=1 Tax=Actinoplanes sp. HUAS TT8 TaxID=3447453 RepID=UPI003F52704F